MLAVKFAPGRDDVIEGPGIPYGGPHQGKDLSGEFFTKKTELCLDWFNERPLLFHHGLDEDAQTTVVGRVKSWQVKGNVGLWTQAQLDRSNAYFDAIKDLVKKGKLFFSSGAMPHLVETNKSTGEIIRWPWVELSLTPTPCNLYATVDQVKSHYKSAGIPIPPTASLSGLKAELSTDARNNLDNSDFAYIDSDGGKHLPIHDAAHVRNALARFGQTHFESGSAKEKARKKILAAARRFGIDVSDDSGKAVYFHHGDAVGRLLKQSGEYEESRDRLHWYKVVAEEDDAAGGYATEDDQDEGSLDGMAHSMASHMHTHADGTTHAHPHAHMDGSASHDSTAHLHDGEGADKLFPMTGDENKRATFTAAASKQIHLRDMADGDGDYEGSYEDLRDDLLRLLNPTGPFQRGYTSIEATFPGYCIACTWDIAADGDDDRQYYRIDYTIGSDGEPTITKTTPVEQIYVPSEGKSFGSILLDAQYSVRTSVALVERTKGLYERRAREGRTITRTNLEAIGQALEGWRESVKAFEDLLAATTELEREQARAARLQHPDGRKAAIALHEHFAFALELEKQGVS